MSLPGWGGVFKGWVWFPWGYPGAKVSRGVYPPPLRNGQYAVVGTHPTGMLSYLFCFHLHFWCQCYQLSRILGRIEVNDNSSFGHSIDRFAFTLAVLLLICLGYQMCWGLKDHLHAPSTSPFLSGTFDLFNVMCKQHRRKISEQF